MKAVPEGLPVQPKTYRSVQAVPDSSLTTAGKETGCDHYRNGYLGIALCANYYDNIKDGEIRVKHWRPVTSLLSGTLQIAVASLSDGCEGEE
jgi:hypothetical protein